MTLKIKTEESNQRIDQVIPYHEVCNEELQFNV